ncbi:MAG: OsmC family peroxiredoxin [Dehalococcoidia bacterium]|nr:OsmC family peroxiredoxin [Dehalococcoidia bacterium]
MAGERVAAAVEQVGAIFRRRPAAAIGQKTASATLSGDGWQVEMGAHRLTVDQPKALEGDDPGPNPGDLMRGALAACLVQNVASHAARFGIRLDEVTATVATEIDLGPAMGVPSAPFPGFSAINYQVTVVTDAPEERVAALMDYGSNCSAFGGYVPARGPTPQGKEKFLFLWEHPQTPGGMAWPPAPPCPAPEH